jgi:mono/diheme cytochrome c family protein
MKMKKTLIMITAGLFAVVLLSFSYKQTSQPSPWAVPDAYKTKVNPLKGDAASLTKGKDVYNQFCKSCHGTKGKGDGPKASQLDTECGDFTKASFHEQTDGSLFYKTYQGRKDMPSYKTKIPEANDIWAVVNYIRTMK